MQPETVDGPSRETPWVAILNPASGSSDEDFRAAIEKALQESGTKYEIRETTPERSGTTLAVEAVRAGAVRLLACGGDGTVMAVINGLAGEVFGAPGEAAPRVTLGIVPGGTANLVASALDLPMDTEGAVAAALHGRDREIDLGRCGEFVFALGVGVGLTERLVSQASAREKETLGRWAYLRAMLRELGARPHRFTLRLDDGPPVRERGVAVVVANTGEIGHGMRFAPDAKLDDGLLDVCILHRFYLRDALRMAWRVLAGGLRYDRAVTFHQARRVELVSEPPLDAQIDGEPVALQTPLVAEALPGALRVRVPEKKDEAVNG